MYFLIPAILSLPVAIFCYNQNNTLTYSTHKIGLGLKSRMRILQLSDLHSKEFGKDNTKLVNKIIGAKPNIIFATGDLIDSSLRNMDKIIDFLSTLNKIAPVIYIPGNNEIRCGKLSEIIYKLKKCKVITLTNQIVSLEINSNFINILGLAEKQEDNSKYFLAKGKSSYQYYGAHNLFMELERRKGLKIVLSHYPENYNSHHSKAYSKYNFDLMFSGHAHGGQFIIPKLGGLFAPGQGVLPKYYSGIYGSNNKNKLIVSRGLGNSGFPLRLFNKPDIVIVDIY